MRNPLPTLHKRLLKRLPDVKNVKLYETLDDTERLHLVPNQVRIRVLREKEQLRVELSGLLGAIHPSLGTPQDEEERMTQFFGPCMVQPPMYFKDEKGVQREFDSVMTRNPGQLLAISKFDGGLGAATVHRNLEVTHTIPDELILWNESVNKVTWVIAEEIEALGGMSTKTT